MPGFDSSAQASGHPGAPCSSSSTGAAGTRTPAARDAAAILVGTAREPRGFRPRRLPARPQYLIAGLYEEFGFTSVTWRRAEIDAVDAPPVSADGTPAGNRGSRTG